MANPMTDEELLDALGVEVEAKAKSSKSPREERIIAGFEDIERFVEQHGRLCDTFRLIVAAVITLLIIITFLYLLPINDIPNIVPNYLIETTKDLTISQKKAVNELYLNGKLTDARGLYGEIVEYYHFLVFLVFALLALVGGFVYLQIRHETTAKINKAIREGIAEAEIEKKIKDQIDQVDINKKIEEVINEEAVGDTVTWDRCYWIRYHNKEMYTDVNGDRRVTTDPSNEIAYRRIAEKVINEPWYKLRQNYISCWGTEEIENAATGKVGGKSPQHWIAVRANIHMSRVIDLVSLI